jgi:alpha/beta superfamily hydrolase
MSALPEPDTLVLRIREVELSPPTGDYMPLDVSTSRGNLLGRYFQSLGATSGVICVGGVGGGWDSPAKDLYCEIGRHLRSTSRDCLWLNYRTAGLLADCTLDVLAGIAFLKSHGIEKCGLIGWSFGGAVAIQAAVYAPETKTVITIATQSYGADLVAEFRPDCSLLLIHGKADPILPSSCSENVYALAPSSCRLEIIPGAGHSLNEKAEFVQQMIKSWLDTELQ